MPRLAGYQVAAVILTAAQSDPGSPLRTDRNKILQAMAISRGESGWRTDAIGDVNLQDATWGPSGGLFQIRSIKAQTGTGNIRDINILLDPVANANSMMVISGGGTSWQPWSVWTNGSWRNHMDEAEAGLSELERRIGGPIPDSIDDSFGLLADVALDIDESVVQPVAGVVGAALDPLGGIGAFLTDRGMWLRVGLAVAGFALLVVGLFLLAGDARPALSLKGA